MATGPFIANLTAVERREVVRSELRASLTYAAFARLPFSMLTGNLTGWFDRYVYTDRVRALMPQLRMGQRVMSTVGAASTVTFFYVDLYMLSRPAARPFIYRPATATFQWCVERAFERGWRQVINAAIRAQKSWVRRLALHGVLRAVPYVGWVINGALLYLDYQLVKETWLDLYNIRESLIAEIVEQIT